MALNKGKKWEASFAEDWKLAFPNDFLYRLPDQQSRYFGTSGNLSDFIAYNFPYMYIIECKSHEGNTFPLSCLDKKSKTNNGAKSKSQYERLLEQDGKSGVFVYVLLWFVDHQKVFAVPISTFKKIKENNLKSFHINMQNDPDYPSIEIPSITKRVYPRCDFTVLYPKEK